MHKPRSCIVAWAAFAILAPGAGTVGAFDLPEQIVDLHGRAEIAVESDESSTAFPYDAATRSPMARSRLMTSLAGGNDRYGRLYLKGVARWSAYERNHDGAELLFDQGDYLWRRRAGVSLDARAFANERRYFTHTYAPGLLDDGAVDGFENHGGVRVDGERGPHWSWSALGAVLDDGVGDVQSLGYAALAWRSHAVQAHASWLADEVPGDSLGHHAAIMGEVAGHYRNAALIVSWAQTGLDDHALFVPQASADLDGFVGNNFTAVLPEAASAFAEARLADVGLRKWGRLDVVHRYRATGSEYVNRLADVRPGEVENTTGLFFAHRTLALDARVVYHHRVRYHFINATSELLETQVHALFADGTGAYLRAGVGHRDEPQDVRTNDNFIHAAVSRSIDKLEAGVHVMVRDIDDGGFDRRFAMEARLNWTANVALYGRVIADEEAASNGAVFCRLEVRPARHVFATLGFGRREVGDGPYVVEDPDIGAVGDIESVYTLTVRGDF